jgi:hypothetical protein
MTSSRIKFRHIGPLAWTTALAFTARRFRDPNNKWVVQAQKGWAVAAFPIYWATLVKSWMAGTAYTDGCDVIVSLVDRRRASVITLRSAVVTVVGFAALYVIVAGAADGKPWSLIAYAALFVVLIVILISAVIELVRGTRATGGKPHRRGGAVKRLDPRWIIEGLAQRPGNSGGFEFAQQTLLQLGAAGDGVLTVARDPYLRRAYQAMKFIPTPEDPDVMFRRI